MMMGNVFGYGLNFVTKGKNSDLKGPTAIVTLLGLLDGIAMVLAAGNIMDYGSEIRPYLVIGGFFTIGVSVVITYLMWVFYTGAFYTVATYAFDANGDFSALLRVVGWGFIGLLVARVTTFSINFSVGFETSLSGPISVLSTLAGFASGMLFLVTLILWIESVFDIFRIGLKESVITVVVPVAFSMVVLALPYLI